MSTNGMESWAVDLANVGAIYPFQGTEGLWLIAGLVFWIAFHVIQTRGESNQFAKAERDFNASQTEGIDGY